MSDAQANIASLIGTLAARFVTRTLAELPQIRAASARFHEGDPAAHLQLKQWAHRIRGTAGSLRLAAISAQASAIEDALSQEAHRGAPDQLAGKLAAMEAHLTRLAGTGET
jgi:HPt (histidine-containing phosphotransfer) domain-containing protein